MIRFAWPWVFLLLPLPWLVRSAAAARRPGPGSGTARAFTECIRRARRNHAAGSGTHAAVVGYCSLAVARDSRKPSAMAR